MKKHKKQTPEELDRLTYSAITFIGCAFGGAIILLIAIAIQ